MSKIINLFGEQQDVRQALEDCIAADMTEVFIIGKKRNGNYFCRYSPSQNAVEYIGMVELLKNDLLADLNDNWVPSE